MNQNDLPAFKQNDWEPPAVNVEVKASGEQIVSTPYQSLPVADDLIKMLRAAVNKYPLRTFLAKRNAADEWERLTYAEIDARSSKVAQWLLNQNLPDSAPVMVLSENSLEHAIMMFGALKARLPLAPVSPGYSLLSRDHLMLGKIVALVEPAVVFVQDLGRYNDALNSLKPNQHQVVYVSGECNGGDAVSFDTLLATPEGPEVEDSCQNIKPSTVAKILFTSGSTGEPKGVVNTHQNICFPQSAFGAVVHIDSEARPPVMLDWLPWHHTYGGNQNINRTIRYAGTLYIDDGKPIKGLFERTLRNLREVKVTTFSTVPAAYMVLLDALESDEALRKNLFSELDWFSYGGSDMPQHIFDRVQKVAIETTGMRIPVITAMGSTETSSVVTVLYWATEKMGNIGLPVPGTTLKLIPLGDKFELRSKGPQIMPGYFKNPQASQAAFDEDGYFCTGDAVRWIDESDPKQGLMFAGRVAEDFKLLSGTWVHTGALRNSLVSALSPLISDVVIAGHDKDYIAVLAWANEGGVRALEDDQTTALSDLTDSDFFRQRLVGQLEQYNAENNHASARIKRMIILNKPPSMDDNEITDKRYINQRMVLEKRADQVLRLFSEAPDAEVIYL